MVDLFRNMGQKLDDVFMEHLSRGLYVYTNASSFFVDVYSEQIGAQTRDVCHF